MIYVTNAFSFQMMNEKKEGLIKFKAISTDEVISLLTQNRYFSAIGHEGTAKYLSNLLGINLDFNRIGIKLEDKDILIVCQYTGGRMNGGDFYFSPDKFKFYRVEIQ